MLLLFAALLLLLFVARWMLAAATMMTHGAESLRQEVISTENTATEWRTYIFVDNIIL